jgi:hypothetical protein
MRREIVYPILLACADTVSNSYWKQVLTDMGYGSCPTGSYISNGTLTSSTFAWELPTAEDDEEYIAETTDNLIQLLQDNLGLFSAEDTAEKQEHFYQVLASKNPNETPENWPDLKKIYGKTIPISHFVAEIFTDTETKILDLKTAKRVLADINLGLGLKTLGNDDIVVKNGKIFSIPPLGLQIPNSD